MNLVVKKYKDLYNEDLWIRLKEELSTEEYSTFVATCCGGGSKTAQNGKVKSAKPLLRNGLKINPGALL